MESNRLEYKQQLTDSLENGYGKTPESQPESELAKRVLEILKKGEMGKARISEVLGNKSISGELNKQIRILQKEGYIEMILPDKPNSRLQKYKLTKKD